MRTAPGAPAGSRRACAGGTARSPARSPCPRRLAAERSARAVAPDEQHRPGRDLERHAATPRGGRRTPSRAARACGEATEGLAQLRQVLPARGRRRRRHDREAGAARSHRLNARLRDSRPGVSSSGGVVARGLLVAQVHRVVVRRRCSSPPVVSRASAVDVLCMTVSRSPRANASIRAPAPAIRSNWRWIRSTPRSRCAASLRRPCAARSRDDVIGVFRSCRRPRGRPADARRSALLCSPPLREGRSCRRSAPRSSSSACAAGPAEGCAPLVDDLRRRGPPR